MLTDITLGQYFPGDSLLHRMDARVKIILLFTYIVGIFLFDNNICYGLNTAWLFCWFSFLGYLFAWC